MWEEGFNNIFLPLRDSFLLKIKVILPRVSWILMSSGNLFSGQIYIMIVAFRISPGIWIEKCFIKCYHLFIHLNILKESYIPSPLFILGYHCARLSWHICKSFRVWSKRQTCKLNPMKALCRSLCRRPWATGDATLNFLWRSAQCFGGSNIMREEVEFARKEAELSRGREEHVWGGIKYMKEPRAARNLVRVVERRERRGRDVQRWDEEGVFMPCQYVWSFANETWGEMHLRIISRGVM